MQRQFLKHNKKKVTFNQPGLGRDVDWNHNLLQQLYYWQYILICSLKQLPSRHDIGPDVRATKLESTKNVEM